MITGLNHLTLAVRDVEIAFAFYGKVLGFTPLCKWAGCAYFLIGQPNDPHALWLCLDRDETRQNTSCSTHYAFSVSPDTFQDLSSRILTSGSPIYKENTSPGDSLYFQDPDGHKLEIYGGSWQSRIRSKKENPGKWQNVEWFI
jgi:catechol 2,3-dioxygenase-like lactoylglutathione lyase family enzyme